MAYTAVAGIARGVTGACVGVNGVARAISNGYVGVNGVARKINYYYAGKENIQRTMAKVWTGENGSAYSLQAANVSSKNIEGTSWRDSGHELVITLSQPYNPESITFTTPTIVNSGQASEVTYSIYGSNSAYSSTLSNMTWTTLVSNATWTQSFQGNATITLNIPDTGVPYKHIRMTTTWFYGANDYHGVYYGGLKIEAKNPTYQAADTALAPYNQAMKLAGQGTAASLSAVLTNSDYCKAISNNATATKIMKENYSSDITTAIDSNWNEGLNLLAHNCKLKFYFIRGWAGIPYFSETTNGFYQSGNLNGQRAKTGNMPIDTTGYSAGVVSLNVGSSWSAATARAGLSKLRNVNGGYDEYYNNNSVTQTNCPDPAADKTNLSFTISDQTYVYPMLGFSCGTVNGYTANVTGRITNFALTP